MLKDIVNLHKKPFSFIIPGTALVTLLMHIIGNQFFNQQYNLQFDVKLCTDC